VLTTVLAAAEPSHLAFYIAGAVFAVWAVVVSWVGLTRPSFPFNVTGQRAVIGVSFILAAVAIAMAVVTSK
jgi:hypothetical protein